MDNPDRVDGQFIVIYRRNVTAQDAAAHQIRSGLKSNIFFTYDIGDLFRGFAARLNHRELARILSDPLVKEVHCDGIERIACDNLQSNVPSWGLARASHFGSIGQGFVNDYYYSSSSGEGVFVYVLDTGIYLEHQNFAGRAVFGANFVDSVVTDQNGHGTHCAGTIGGSTYGIAKQVRLVAVKVLGANGSGSTAGVIRGIEYVAAQHDAVGGPSVGSMSLGSASDGGKNAAIAAAVARGVVIVVAAGNSNGNACNYYPASSPDAISVGATDTDTDGSGNEIDIRSSFSNYGRCVHVFAPGSAITSCGITSPTSSRVLSGTSMACPHVAGHAAVILSENPNFTPATVKATIQALAVKDVINNVGPESPNLLLYNGCYQ